MRKIKINTPSLRLSNNIDNKIVFKAKNKKKYNDTVFSYKINKQKNSFFLWLKILYCFGEHSGPIHIINLEDKDSFLFCNYNCFS